jgi:site-specific DNA recombinase
MHAVAANALAKREMQNRARPAIIRCAIYTRKSTEEGLEQDFNTLDAQREAAESFIRSQKHEGWVAVEKLYDDGGFTGANMDRPALKLLLADIAMGEVNCVVVYKVDRLTRSLLDFSRIMDVLDRHGVTFVAVTQQFNTTSSLGRLTLNILLSFAQFEREMISERTRDKMSAARKKGKWMGGRLVLGYDVAPGGAALVVNQQEAAQVCEIYRLYLELGSPILVLQELERRGWRLKAFTTKTGRSAGNGPFKKTTLHGLLTNPIYTGVVRHHGEIYPGEHERIVSDLIWNQVQKRLTRDERRGRHHISDPCGALLKGIVHCASCDVAMTHTYAQKKGKPLYRYYVCGKAHRQGWQKCETRSVSAPALEQAVVGQLATMADDASNPPNEVRLALDRAGTPWREMTDDQRQIFIRTLVREVRYDGRTGNVVVQFDNGVYRETARETATDEGANRIEEEINEDESKY